METTSFCSLLLLLLFLWTFHRSLKRRKEKRPPQPPSIAVIGHLHLLKDPVHRSLQRLSDRYGPFVSLSFGSRPVLLISSPSLVEECFNRNDVVLANRPRLLSGKILDYDYTTIGSAPYGHLWRKLRRVAALEIFSAVRLNSFLEIREDEVRNLVKNLFKASGSSGGFASVEMRSRLSELSFNIIARMVFGKRYVGEVGKRDSDEAKRFRDMISESFEVIATTWPGDYLPILGWLDLRGTKKRMVALHDKSDKILQSIVDERRSRDWNRTEGDTKTTIDTLLRLQESEPEFFTDDIIKGFVMTLLTAGTETSAVAIEWAMSLLLNHPTVLNKARAEIENVVGATRLVKEADLPNLPYIHNIVNETLRLYPPVPLLSPHESSDVFTVGGYEAPKGTMVLTNAWAIHRDPVVWSNPTEFRPERFEEEDAGNRMVAFGMGRRRCPGSGLANKVVGLAVAALVQCFEWDRVGEEEVDMREGKGLSMPRAEPLEALCKPRRSMLAFLSHASTYSQ